MTPVSCTATAIQVRLSNCQNIPKIGIQDIQTACPALTLEVLTIVGTRSDACASIPQGQGVTAQEGNVHAANQDPVEEACSDAHLLRPCQALPVPTTPPVIHIFPSLFH